MSLSVSVENLRTAVGVVVTLKYYVDIIPVEYGSQLSSQNHAVGIGMVQSGTIDILVNGYHPPCYIGVSIYSLFNGLLMLRYIVVVGVQYNEQARSIIIVVISSRLGFFPSVWGWGC